MGLGTCVGQRNQVFFVAFLLLLGVSLFHGLALGVRCVRVLKWWTRSPWLHIILFGWLLMCFCGTGSSFTCAGAFYGVMFRGFEPFQVVRDVQTIARRLLNLLSAPQA